MISIVLTIITITTVVYANEITVNENNLNVRGGPGTSFGVVGQVHKDETYSIVEIQDDWIKIQFEDITGWVTSEFVTVSGQSETVEEIESNHEITILQNNTHIRNEPTTDSDIIHFAKVDTVFSVIGESNSWYHIQNDDISGYVLKSFVEKSVVNNQSSGIKNKTIVLDAGHGGRDVGAIGATGSYEKDLTLKTSLILAEELTNLGAKVILTRSDDEFIPLESRSAVSNNAIADAFISIHYNSTPELPNVTGINTYYYYDHSIDLANHVQNEIIQQTETRDRGIAFGDYLVIRTNMVPSLLLELGFVSNEESEQLLLTNAYQTKLVTGIVNGLVKYFEK